MNFKLGDYEGPVTFLNYYNGRTAFSWNSNEGEPLATITVNLPDMELDNDEVIINTNNMNNIGPVLSALRDQGFITDGPTTLVASGFCTYPVCKLTKEVLDLISKE